MGDLKSARTPYIYDIAIGTKNTEYSKELPAGLKQFQVKLTKASIYHIYFDTGVAAASRWKIAANGTYSVTGIDIPSSTYLYVICPSTPATLSFIGWGG